MQRQNTANGDEGRRTGPEAAERNFIVVAASAIIEQPAESEIIYLDCLKSPGEWARLSEAAREYVRRHWPGYAPGATTPRLGDLNANAGGIVSVLEPIDRNVAVMLQPIGGMHLLSGLDAGSRESYGEVTIGPFSYVRSAISVEGAEVMLDDCEQEIARREPGGPWTTADGRVWGDIVIGNTIGLLASLVDGGLGTAGGGRPQ